MSLKDIASDIQNILGLNYKILVNDNTNLYIDISDNTVIEDYLEYTSDYYIGVIRKQVGGMVALRDIFTTTYGYTLEIFAPSNSTVLDDLESMILQLNGALQTTTTHKYVITFSEPIPSMTEISNGGFFHKFIISGDVAISDKSLFGNDFKIKINNQDLLGLISANPQLQPKFEGDLTKEGKLAPSIYPDYYTSTINLTLHARNDDALTIQLLKYTLNPNLLLNNEEFALSFDFFGYTETWLQAYLTGISFEATIGGYIIISVGFVRNESD